MKILPSTGGAAFCRRSQWKPVDPSHPILVATFYRFFPFPNFQEVRSEVRTLGEGFGLCGSVLLAAEGVNATVAGPPDGVRSFLQELSSLLGTAPFECKFSETLSPPFARWKVRLKREIVTMKAREADPLKGVGEYVEPAQWNALVDDPEVTVIDVRNRFEIEYGTFAGAIDPDTDDFSEFPGYVEANLKDKHRPIAMFCTGGIRCEKATAYLLAHGYENVKHLRGGILKYLETVPPEETRWHGSCFVFDERVALDHSLHPAKTED